MRGKKIRRRTVNFHKTKDVGIMEALWDNFHVKSVDRKESITRKQIEKKLKDSQKSLELYKELKMTSLTRGAKKLVRKNIRQLKYLLKKM